ncbi:PDGF- and VEGF-related factor 1 isoform X2 [Augochlora pura]
MSRIWPSLVTVVVILLVAGITGITIAKSSPSVDNPNSDLSAKEYLELMQKINDMDSMDEFMKHVEGAPIHHAAVGLVGIVGRIGFDGEERSNAIQATPAKCMPELQPVSLTDNQERSVLYFPSCTRIKRCGGCCSHALLSCQPVATELRNYEVTVVSIGNKNRMTYKENRIVPLEEHTKCKCDCTIKEEHCKENQSYVKSECGCKCNNVDEEEKCLRNRDIKVWDPDRCICLCRDEEECSTGLYFDQNSCRCKQLPLSRTWFQPIKGTDYRFTRTQKPDTEPPVIVPLDAADPRRKPKDDPEY